MSKVTMADFARVNEQFGKPRLWETRPPNEAHLPIGWVRTNERHAPLYTDVLVLCQSGFVSVGHYIGHGAYTHQRYPVLGQCKATHWQPLPDHPREP